jgi:hypothetical protein
VPLSTKEFHHLYHLARGTREYLARGGQPIPFSTDDQRLIAKLIIELAPSVLGPLNDVGTTPAVQACDRCGREVAPALLTETVSGDYVCGACADQSQREHRIGNDDPHDPRPEEAPPRDTHAAAMTPLSTLAVVLAKLSEQDVTQLIVKDAEYGSSWKQRGGVGAFMMLARKWDRLQTQVQRHGWDVFAAAHADGRDEGVLDDIRDLRRYLLLVDSEVTRV